MTANEERLINITGNIWKNTGVLATYEEVMAAKAAINEMLPYLEDNVHERGRALDLLYSLARYEWKVMPADLREETLNRLQQQQEEDTEKQRRGEID